MSEIQTPEWRRSSFCSGGTCVEVAKVGEHVMVRDGKKPNLPAHSFTAAEWSAFVAGVKAGEFAF